MAQSDSKTGRSTLNFAIKVTKVSTNTATESIGIGTDPVDEADLVLNVNE